jgi:hypothetical protein
MPGVYGCVVSATISTAFEVYFEAGNVFHSIYQF